MEVINTIGRRKNAVARVYLKKGKGEMTVNNKVYTDYFPIRQLLDIIEQPFSITDTEKQFDAKIIVKGGGPHGQAGAIRLGIARALVKLNEEEYKQPLKEHSLLTRDPREVERKKFGQKKARKKFQYSKR